MHARQTTLQADPSKIEDGLRFFRERALPTLRQAGARGVRFLADRQSGRVLVVSLWESAEAAQAAEATIQPVRAEGAQVLGATGAPTTEVLEVLLLEDF